MARNSLVLIIRWLFVVCSFFVICLQLVHAEQYALLVGVWDYENPNLQLEAPPNDLKLMEAVLSAHGVTQGQMHILTNPNKAQIQRKFRELSRRGGFPALSTHATPATYSERFVWGDPKARR